VKELGEIWLEKDPRLSLAHLCICAGGKVLIAGAQILCAGGISYRRRINFIFTKGNNQPRRDGPSPPYPRRIWAVFAGGKSSTPGAQMRYAPGINLCKGRPSRGGPTSQYHWRTGFICAGDN
jgi:hypothetical protein